MSLPKQRNYEYAFHLAYGVARERLAKLEDIEGQCLRSGARYQMVDSRRVVVLDYLNQSYQIDLPGVEVSKVGGEGEVPIKVKLLILHYFILAQGIPLSGNIITYKELPEGLVYFPTFAKRAVKPLLDHFGKEPQRLVDVAAKLGGRKADCGDVAVTINAFKYVPLTLVLWRGDEEFAPSASILFDNTIRDYISTEDVTVLCETIAWSLVRLQG
ncbi:DUF3786 domain-containing protein [Chloroflexota bacterium]